MPSEGQLLLRGKDPHPHAFGAFGLGIAGQHKARLGEVHLARDGLHLVAGQPGRIVKHRQRIALEGPLRKDIQDCVLQHLSHADQYNQQRHRNLAHASWQLTPCALSSYRKTHRSGANCFILLQGFRGGTKIAETP
jgi:hypothetical protein